MWANEVLRQFLLKHFGSYQSCEIKALKVTEFCWGKKEKKRRCQNKPVLRELSLYVNSADRGKELLGLKVFALCKPSKNEILQKEHKDWQRNLLQTFVLLENSPLGPRCNPLESSFDLVGMHPFRSHRLWSQVSKCGRTTMKPKINSRELQSFCFGIAAKLEYWKINW